MRPYNVEFEIAGPAAMFSRPDTGAAPVSYPVPTWSACKAMFESIARGFFGAGKQPAAFFCPTEVEIWRPIRFEKYVFNYRGPMRNPTDIKPDSGGGNSYQLPATILVDVCYRVRGECIPVPSAMSASVNAAHALQEMFLRRLKRGNSKYAPCLGWKEFLPTYLGEFRQHLAESIEPPEKQIDTDLFISGLLHSMWDAPVNGVYRPVFREVKVEKGVLKFSKPTLQDGKLIFPE
jgi:CRISPR-associated protein Cas5d